MKRTLITLAALSCMYVFSCEMRAQEPAYIAQASKKTYVVNKEVCGATFTKEANKKFTNYAIKNDTKGIDQMILNGELIVLQKGEKVTMVELGIVLSKVRRSNGQVVYIDTESIIKQ